MTTGNRIISRFLDTIGDGSGSNEAIGDYSGGQQLFRFKPTGGPYAEITRMIVHITDSGAIDADLYGNGITLTNGIQLAIFEDGVKIQDLTDPNHPILSNAHWGHYCYDETTLDFGSGNNHIVIRWTFARTGVPVYLNSSKNQELAVILNDDFSGLAAHGFLVQGNYTDQIER